MSTCYVNACSRARPRATVTSGIRFPVQESDELLQRQFEELSKGLQDDAPAVRVTVASGICSVLNMYWELVPAGTTAAYLKRLTGPHLTSNAL